MPKILLFVGACLVCFGFWIPFNAAKFINSDRKVTATVEEYTPQTLEARLPRPARLFLRYEYAGATYRNSVNAVDKHWASLRPGDTVRLVLSEADPSRFAAEAAVGQTGAVKKLSLFYLILGAALIGLAAFLLKGRT